MAENATKRRPAFLSNVQLGDRVMDPDALRTMAEAHPESFMQRCQELIDKGDFRWSGVRNLGRLFGMLADVQVPVIVDLPGGMKRSIMASAFPLLAGGLTIAGINEAYEAVPTIGQDLVTEMEDNKRTTTVAAVTTLDTQIDRVDEGQEFPEVLAGEEKFEIRSKRNGRRISVTAEAIEENDVPGIAQKGDALGTIAAEEVEEQTLRRVCDIDGSATSPAEPYVLHWKGSAASLYVATANTPGTRAPSGTRLTNNALVDETDLDAARAVLAAMRNTRGKRISIPISRCTLLVPDALVGTAGHILRSEMTPGVANEVNTWGPRGDWRPTLRSTPKLDDLSTTAWYLGWFQRQFTRKWKLRFEFATLSGDTESFLRRRIAFQARVAWDCEIGAVDYVFVVQNLSGAVAP